MIDGETKLGAFKQNLRSNEVYYHLAQGFRA
jgi:L-arabinose isomerase